MAPEAEGSSAKDQFEDVVKGMESVDDAGKESIARIRKDLQALEDMRAEIGLVREEKPENPFRPATLKSSEFPATAEESDGDRLDRLEILVKNLTAMFRNTFGDHALISGQWVDLTGGIDAALMRDKAGYDRSGNMKLEVPEKEKGS